MISMFSNCKELIFLNLSSFDTTLVTDMSFMFHNCIKLKYLDLSNFAPLNITTLLKTFKYMTSLIYLNINSIEINNETELNQTFIQNKNINFKKCANRYNMKNYLSTQNIRNNCSDICFIKNIKIDITKNECINSCKVHGYNYECNNICYTECPERTYIILKNISNKNTLFDEYDDKVSICLDRNPEGYYLAEDGFYKECFPSCKFWSGSGDIIYHNCTECKSNFIFISDSLRNNTNCYEKCPYYYFNENNDYTCTENNNCSGNYNKSIIEKSKCIDKCENDNIYKYEYNNICYKQCPYNTYNEWNEYKCKEENKVDLFYKINLYKNETINESIFQEIKSDLLINYNKIKSGNDIKVETKNILIALSNTFNQKNEKSQNKITINLGECEDKLFKYYNITENASLYILKMEIQEEGIKIPKIEYEVFYPLNGTYLSNLDLSFCHNKRIVISIPISIDIYENEIDKYNINSDYYNDICTKATSERGTDICLSDRRKIFIEKNMTLCEENYNLLQYNFTSKKPKCSCLIKNN